MTGTIDLETNDHVVTITLNNPGRLNAMNKADVAVLRRCLENGEH